ncbi:L-lactate dehydrogenase complex protein LldF [Chitinophaga terrae (ex Kim and Jung 2007)]|uniref:L-lactate dehydrogenase complex protein LldF n=1 Tax=Chitinophaga terrae (ex Kim and Jung 2007) TaxID=408074 RepID=A0A1H4G6B8_9BACT|nr:LutB/LldF family L-lactate oxidation iron-sulfur protein [Chitinophaga terrae (ex Kim and Jung 2007)]MDQ0105637.1 L-lactate dehydrogenase complex protein LldF [Chitinophaga terrae (ex Kim and Jung 2007)]GEP93115.1 lactate utilization protein B [Chitinophaga terrae (ex Kim and Jung 2007)]SEB04977.1 L-lactate dehydrogenase complex protein LldF [Chitinophaga terrae (ex Kim and Jung 2007)]
MHQIAATFLEKSEIKASDLSHRATINFNIGKYNNAVKNGKLQFADLAVARERAKNIKWRAIEHLDNHLEEFEQNFTRRGGKVIWAETAEQVQQEILAICRAKNCKSIVKSKSMATEEVHLNSFMESNGIECVETDLGEYIQQLDGEPPYHIVTPAMHKSKEDVARLFAEKLGTDPSLTPEQLTLVAREKLRNKYLEAEIGITGANFIIADTGSVAVTENEGNARLTTAFPKTHIVLVGIEKVLPSITDLGLFWPLLATYGTGQHVTAYNSIFSGPRQEGEVDGPEEMYVILMDNGRTNILQDTVARESLYCIRCGSCLNACPVYKNIGGHTYDTTYSGPIGSVITPHLQGMDSYMHLSFASSLCGNCTEVCPVRINLHELLLHNRQKAVEENFTSGGEKFAWFVWKQGCTSRKMMNMASGKWKNFFFRRFFSKGWGDNRELPVFAAKSFNQLWKERHS